MGTLSAKEKNLLALDQKVDGINTRIASLIASADDLTRKQTELETLNERLGQVDELAKKTSWQMDALKQSRHDLDALRALAARDLRYLGLIGSRAKVKKIYDALVEEGMPLECLQRVHAPIGLDIGGVTPEEIAISIMAELIAVRRGRIEAPNVASASLQWKKLPASLTKE